MGSLAVGAIILVLIVLFAQLPGRSKFWAVVNDAAHGPVFGLLAVTYLTLLSAEFPRRTGLLVATAFGLAVLTGAGVEWIQGLIGRDSSWIDVGTDALGAACALGLVGSRPILGYRPFESKAGRRIALGVALLTGTLLLAPVIEAGLALARRAAQFPVIARFDSPLDLYFGRVQSASGSRVFLPRSWARPDDGKSLRIEVTAGRWPGFVLSEPEADWTGWKTLNLDMTNPGNAPIQLTVRVHDALHDQRYEDRFNRSFTLEPGRRTLTIPVSKVTAAPAGRTLDLTRVSGIVIFANGRTSAPGQVFFLTKIWLE